MKPEFYVYEPHSCYTKKPHESRRDARIEAERLARLNPGKTFKVLALIDECRTVDVVWESVYGPGEAI